MPSRKPPKIDHRTLDTASDALAAQLAEAVDLLKVVTDREALLAEGDVATRSEIAAIYPALRDGSR